mmetsp:Transcript_3131/g.7103  ORF Transcript_3131/g.7103 Transcript_3131/m.7103 type:complete len:314 (-) Transcript_3131:336-1277(-)
MSQPSPRVLTLDEAGNQLIETERQLKNERWRATMDMRLTALEHQHQMEGLQVQLAARDASLAEKDKQLLSAQAAAKAVQQSTSVGAGLLSVAVHVLLAVALIGVVAVSMGWWEAAEGLVCAKREAAIDDKLRALLTEKDKQLTEAREAHERRLADRTGEIVALKGQLADREAAIETLQQKSLSLDVTPLSLGSAEGELGTFMRIVARNTTIPIKKSRIHMTVVDNQAMILFKVYEGEKPMAEDNHLLGELLFTGIPRAPKGKGRVELTFEIDANGILTIVATEESTGHTQSITIVSSAVKTLVDIKRMVRQSE